MADPNHYIPGLPQNLQGILYTPQVGPDRIKAMRDRYAGDPAMQQRLVVDDRYHQGKAMMTASPLAALATFGGSVPYDAAKMAYFHGPKPIREMIGALTERVFPGEGFNERTTSRPSRAGNAAYLQGMAEGAYGLLRDKIQQVNNTRLPEPVVDGLRKLTQTINTRPVTVSGAVNRLVETGDNIDLGPGKNRQAVADFARRQAVLHALDPVGTGVKLANAAVQTLVPDADTRPQFPAWMEDRGIQALAPGYRPLQPMSPEAKARQNAQLSQLMRSWGPTPGPVTFPTQRVPVPR